MSMDMGATLPHIVCKVCQNTMGNSIFRVREMMFGLRESFAYMECSKCCCVQLVDAPADMSKYYPPEYYSLSESPEEIFHNPIKNWLGGLRTLYGATNRGMVGKLLYSRKPDPRAHLLAEVGITTDTRILDVGCGSGIFLYMLRNAGFANTMGIDPYIHETITYKNGLTIHKLAIHEMRGEWNLIMFHHAYEHVPDPLETLISTARLLAPGGVCLIRIPVSNSYAWEHYRTNWVQLDAPRHYFLHSVASMSLLASQAGLTFDQVIYDSTEFQFWGSEQYQRDIPLHAPQSYKQNPQKSIFTPEQIATFHHQAEELNQQGRGDQAAFYLRKP
jgi:SAM-dependent methyltransferase